MPLSKTITQLPSATTPYDGTEEFAMWQGGATVKGTLPASPVSSVKNLRDYGVTTSSTARENTDAILQALEDAGPTGTMVVPNLSYESGGVWYEYPIPHYGFTLPVFSGTNSQVIEGEDSGRGYTLNTAGGGSYLHCLDNTTCHIGTMCSTRGLTIRNLTLKGGYYGIRLGYQNAANPNITNQGFCIENMRITGTRRAGLGFQSHCETGRVLRCMLQTNKPAITANGYGDLCLGIEWINQHQQTNALVSVDFDLWIYGEFDVGVYLVAENPQQSLQGTDLGRVRVTHGRYAPFVVRCSVTGGLQISCGSEAGQTYVPSGYRVGLLADATRYGAPASLQINNIWVVDGSAGTSDFDVICRGGSCFWDGDGNRLDASPANSIGVRNTGGAYRNARAPDIGLDPPVSSTGKTTVLGAIDSDQPVLDLYPRGGQFADGCLMSLVSDYTDDDDDFYLMAANL